MKQKRGTTSIPGGSPRPVRSSSTELFLVAATFGVMVALGPALVLSLVLIVVRSWILLFIFLLVLCLNQIGTRIACGRGALVGAAALLCGSRNSQQEKDKCR